MPKHNVDNFRTTELISNIFPVSILWFSFPRDVKIRITVRYEKTECFESRYLFFGSLFW